LEIFYSSLWNLLKSSILTENQNTMKTIIYLFAFSIIFASCASHKTVVLASTGTSSANAANASGDGSSFEKAIYITENHETPGIHAEYAG